MYRYTVLDDATDGRVILKDVRGEFHLARAEQSPPYGAQLEGDRPTLGVLELVSASTGTVYAMKFERIDFDPLDAFER